MLSVTKFIWCLVWSLAVVMARGAGLAVVEAHSSSEFRTQGPVWAMVRDETGRLYVGTEQLLVLDGERWQRIEVPGARQFRALAKGNDKIWVGAAGELGFLETDGTGATRFVSLLKELRSAKAEPGEIWSVQATSQGAVFVGTQQMMRWDGTRFTVWPLPCRQRLLAFEVGSELWFFQDGVGLLRMVAEGPKLLWAEKDLPGAVLWALAGPGGNPLIGTIEGAFLREGNQWTKLPQVSEALAGKLAIGAVRVNESEVAVGTFLNGIVLFSPGEERVVTVIDRNTGLKDDSIHTLQADKDGSIWAGTAGGFARIIQPGNVALFDERNGFAGGPVLTTLPAAGETVIVTDRAVQRTRHGPLSTLPAVEGLLRDATVRNDEIWVGGFGGIWRSDPAGWVHEHYVSAEVHRMAASRHKLDWIWFVEGFAPRALVNTERGWAAREFGLNLRDVPADLYEDEAGDLWVSTPTSGIWRLQLKESEDRQPELKVLNAFRNGVGLPNDTEPGRLAPVGDQMFVFTNKGILGRLRPGYGFEAMPVLGGLTGIAATKGGSDAYWIVERREANEGTDAALVRVSAEGKEVSMRPVAFDGLGTVGRVTRVDWVKDELWIGGTEGVLRVSQAALERTLDLPQVRFTSILTTHPTKERGGKPDTQRLPLIESGRLASDTGTVRFEWSAGVTAGEMLYQTALARDESGDGDWTPPTRTVERDFLGLAPGAYRFVVRAVDRFGRTSAPAGFAFVVLPPWWATRLAYAGYGAGLILLVAGYLRWRISRLRKQNERLNRLIEERTKELAMANTAKSEFLANISHEIRNPLNGIVGLVTILGRAKLPEEERDLAKSLGACVRSLTRVFEEVLGFSKLEYGQVTLRPVTFTVGAVLDEVMRVFRATAAQRGNTLKLVLPAEADQALYGDEEKIKTIASNFLANALKYAPEAVVEIGATVEPEAGTPESAPEEFTLCLFVSDHGPGIPADEQELIFRKFVRGHSAEARREPGAGLGLATCRALAELMGGGVSVESPALTLENGQRGGSTFYLHLKLPAAAVVPINVTTTKVPATEAEPWLGQESGRALIAEDQEYNQMVIRRLVERLGFTAVIAADGNAALARLGEGPCAVAFVDWDLPGMKGSELARKIRATERGRDTIIFAATAHDSDEIRAKCKAAGMDGFLLKPLDEAMVAAALAQVRKEKQRGKPAELNFPMFKYVGNDDPLKTQAAIGQYLEILAKELAELQKAGTREAVAHHAHRLLAHANVLRAQALGAAAHAIEINAATADGAQMDGLIQELARAAGLVRAKIEEYQRSTAESPAQR